MGYEYITQPQIFTAPITALNGIQGINESYPLITTYQNWISSSPVPANIWPIPGTWSMINNPGSFVITITGTLVPPNQYSINSDLRRIIFTDPIGPLTEVAFRQLATASPSAQEFIYIKSLSGNFLTSLSSSNASFLNVKTNTLTATNLVVDDINIRNFEINGFKSTGNLDVQEVLTVSNNIATTNNGTISAAGSLIANNNLSVNGSANITNGLTVGLNSILNGTVQVGSNLTVGGNITSSGSISTNTDLSANNGILTREINLVHSQISDGVDPILNIGETSSTGFSGVQIRYQENSNRLLITTSTNTTSNNSVIIDRDTGRVGIFCVPNHALTITGNVSATGGLFLAPAITDRPHIKFSRSSPTLNASTSEGDLYYTRNRYLAGYETGGHGLIFAPFWARVNSDRVKTNNTTNLEGIFDSSRDSIPLIANEVYFFKGWYYIVTSVTSPTSHQPQIGFIFSQSEQDIWYEYTWQTGIANTTTQNTGYQTTDAAFSIGSGGTGSQTVLVKFEGYFTSNASNGGTLIPAFTQSAAGTSSAPTIKQGSWFMLQPIGPNSHGDWS